MDRPVGKYERLARERNDRDLALAAQPGGHPRGLKFDQAAADRVVQFIERFCRHHEGELAGQTVKLEEWQKRDIIGPIFGWKRKNGTRRFRTAYIEIPRKNGKSFLCSAFALYLLVADGEPGGQVYSSATKEEQAAIVWRGASEMVKKSPELQPFVREHTSKGGTLYCDKLGSFFKPLGADSSTLDGLNPHGQIVDELHEHKDRRVWAKLQSGTGGRRQPLTIAITTAGVYDPVALGWQEHQYSIDVLEGSFTDDSRFAFIATIDEGDDMFSVETQKKANPNYGVSAYADPLKEAAELAARQSEEYNDYLRYRLNVWVQQVRRWLSVEHWKACDPLSPEEALEQRAAREETLAGLDCWGGLDIASRNDLAAAAFAFPGDDGITDLLLRCWMPQDKIDEHQRKGRVNFALWAEQGWITATPGNSIDQDFIRRDLNEFRSRFNVMELAYDPHDATKLATELGESDGFMMVEHRQGFISMSEPSKAFAVRNDSHKFRHGGNPVFAWAVGNAVARVDPAGNIKPDKEKAKDKIDPVVAGIMANGRAELAGGASVYEEHGLQSLDDDE